ncbi:MAG: GNAT family N-acetyltransferase, partial [Chloroflexi bacterium]|nr:GNAT family N-acetyltransferase [Chloroflexota bacterium]
MSEGWQIRAARVDDLPAINRLVSSVDGDLHQLDVQEFLVAEDADGAILACGRLRPYPDFCEMASLAVNRSARTQGLGRAIVAGLLDLFPGKIYLVCEDQVVEFFRPFGFG